MARELHSVSQVCQ